LSLNAYHQQAYFNVTKQSVIFDPISTQLRNKTSQKCLIFSSCYVCCLPYQFQLMKLQNITNTWRLFCYTFQKTWSAVEHTFREWSIY